MHPNLQRRTFLQRIAALGILGASPFGVMDSMAAPRLSKRNGLTVLFQGDSITDGGRWRDSSDLNHNMGQSYPYLLSGRLSYDHAQRQLTFINRGISGNTVADLLDRWHPDAIDLQPDIVSILVGVNDLDRFMQGRQDKSADRFEKSYRELLSLTREKLPGVQLILIEPFLLAVGRIADNWEGYSTELAVRQKIVAQMAAEFNAQFIPTQRAFNNALSQAPAGHWIWDGIHPTPAGHELLAREWLRPSLI